jgi:ribosomal-protein-alanine N-acetyltransferase
MSGGPIEPGGWVIEPASVADLDAVAAIEVHSFAQPRPRSTFARELELPQARLVVLRATPGARVLGFANWWLVAGDLAELHVIAVAPDERRRGRAAGLLAHVLAACPDRRVQLEVRASNQPARALYARAGFVVDGRRPRYYPDGEDAVLMSWRAA